MRRNFLKIPHCDIADYDFRRLSAWSAAFWRALIAAWRDGIQQEPLPAGAVR